jgi:hypothetical protein
MATELAMKGMKKISRNIPRPGTGPFRASATSNPASVVSGTLRPT